MIGPTGRCLGVRLVEVVIGVDGFIDPATGGMSVAPTSLWNLPNHRRPRGLGRGSTGPTGDRVFSIEDEPLEAVALTVRIDSNIHAYVEPAVRMLKDAYDRALAATREAWKTIWPT